MPDINVDVALVHAPVVNKKGETIGSAVTNLDLHDIARACRTYGVDTYRVVTPYAEQQKLARQIVGHWLEGHGKTANPDRGDALDRVVVCSTLEEAVGATQKKWGQNVQVIATCAREQADTIGYHEMRAKIEMQQPLLLLFGTAWGLAPEVFKMVDATLPPIVGTGAYNHLSVRSAVSIILDRLLGKR